MSIESASKTVVIDGTRYVPEEPVVESPVTPEIAPLSDPIGESVPFWAFLQSPQFWMLVVGSCASVLVRDDFQTMPWNQIVGQILTLLGAGSASFGLLNKVSKNLSKGK